jgi:large subunit ribosomal protein L13
MPVNKTFSPKAEHIDRRWWVIDADGVALGRLASQVAAVLRGKHKPVFAPHLDNGDFVVVVNAAKVEVTSGKGREKVYYRHSGFPGGLRMESFEQLRARRPERVIEAAVRGMLPKNRLGRRMARKLKVYAGPDHPHHAQQPMALALDLRKVQA